MLDRISNQNSFGNPTSHMTIVPRRRFSGNHLEDRPPKRQKAGISNTVTSSHGYTQGSGLRRNDGDLFSHPKTYIMIEDDDDVGVAVPRQDLLTSSPDPIILPSRTAALSFSREPHSLSVNPRREYAQTPTPTIEVLRNKHHKRELEVQSVPDSEVEEIPTDDIEDFDDDVKPGPSKPAAPERVPVQQLVERYEKGTKHLDLKSVARNMKPKGGTFNDKKSLVRSDSATLLHSRYAK